MLRVAVLTLLVASILTGSLEAQRAAGGFRGHAAGPPVRSSLGGQHSVSKGFFPQPGLPNGFFPNHFRFRRGAFSGFSVAPYFFPGYVPFFGDYAPFVPDYGPSFYEQAYADVPSEPPFLIIMERPDVEPPSRATGAPLKPLMIEVPAGTSSAPSETLPTIFILANGERLESRRFVLTASNLFISIDRHERAIPVRMLDLNATVAANRERGIDLRVPADRNEISLSF